MLVVIINNPSLYSQNYILDPQELVADIIEELSSKSDNEIDFTSISEDLYSLIEEPIYLNSCSVEDLSRLIFLSDFQVQSLWDYIQVNKPVINLFELQLVYGFEKSDVLKLSPFIRFDNQPGISFNDMAVKGKHELSVKYGTTIETPKGYREPDSSKLGYFGDKYSVSTRYRYSYSDVLQFGLTTEKDPGEKLFSGSNRFGFDYLSGYLIVSNIGKVKKLAIGDFNAEFGQGLTFWSSLSSGNFISAQGLRKRARGLTKHSSTNESRFLRGAGITISNQKTDYTLFGSAKKVDANMIDTLIDGKEYFTSLQETGLHRIVSEIENRHSLQEAVTGVNILHNGKKAKIGIVLVHHLLDGEFLKDSTLKNISRQKNNESTKTGIYFDFNLMNHYLFGEYSTEIQSKECGILVGGVFKLSSKTEYSIIGRHYTKGYASTYTSGFAAGSSATNERGVFSGLTIYPLKGVKLQAFTDVYVFPWLKHGLNAPSKGWEYYLQSEVTIAAELNLTLMYKGKLHEGNFSSVSNPIIQLINKRTQSFTCRLTYNTEGNIILRSRFDLTWVDADSTTTEQGYQFLQDISYVFSDFPLSITARYSVFDTESWSSRIYTYENDLPYSFSVTASSSKGSHCYFLIKTTLWRRYDLWIKWAHTWYHSLEAIGSGLEEIDGNKKNELRFMVRVRF